MYEYVSICPHLRRIRNNKQTAFTWTFRHESWITIGLAEHSAITFTYHNTSIFKKGAVDQSEWSQFNFGRVSPLKLKQIRRTPNLSRMLCHRGKSLTAENDLALLTFIYPNYKPLNSSTQYYLYKVIEEYPPSEHVSALSWCLHHFVVYHVGALGRAQVLYKLKSWVVSNYRDRIDIRCKKN